MDVRKKLVELLQNDDCPLFMVFGDKVDVLADYLIAHGVTVQDGKPLEAFLHPIDAYKGLKAKYLVFKADTGKTVDNCFILRPDKDPAAVEALRAYANATDNKTLAEDIYSWVGKGEPVQEWISVKDRLPEPFGSVLAYVPSEAPRLLVHGRWRRRSNEMTCSKCRFIYYSNHDDFNYCPNCGAKMDGGMKNTEL